MKTNAKKLSGKELDALFDIKPMLKTKEEIREEKIYERLKNLSTFNYTWGVPVFLYNILQCVTLLSDSKKIPPDWGYSMGDNVKICLIIYVILSIIHYITNTPKIDKYQEFKGLNNGIDD